MMVISSITTALAVSTVVFSIDVEAGNVEVSKFAVDVIFKFEVDNDVNGSVVTDGKVVLIAVEFVKPGLDVIVMLNAGEVITEVPSVWLAFDSVVVSIISVELDSINMVVFWTFVEDGDLVEVCIVVKFIDGVVVFLSNISVVK